MVDFDTRRKGELVKEPESAGAPSLDTSTATAVAEALELLPDARIDVVVRPATQVITLDPARYGFDSAVVSQRSPNRINFTGQNGEPSHVTSPSFSERDSDQAATTTVLNFGTGRLSRLFGEPSLN